MMCFVFFHRWRWFSLYDPGELRSNLHVSQCLRCRKIVGGWRGEHSA
jgi:hypothetical protein